MDATRPMSEITAPARDAGLAPPLQRRKRRAGGVILGFSAALGLGVAGGMNVQRVVGLDQVASILQSGYEATRHELGRRIASITSKPVAASPATPTNGEAIERAV